MQPQIMQMLKMVRISHQNYTIRHPVTFTKSISRRLWGRGYLHEIYKYIKQTSVKENYSLQNRYKVKLIYFLSNRCFIYVIVSCNEKVD